MKLPTCSSCRLFYKDYAERLRAVNINKPANYVSWLTNICNLQHLYREPLQYPFTIKEGENSYYFVECGSFIKIQNPEEYFCQEHIDQKNFQFYKNLVKKENV